MVSTVHWVPSQASASVTWAPVPKSIWDPTATQAVAEVHEIPEREPNTDWMLHALPSQDSTNGLPEGPNMDPIAMQAEAEAHETDVSEEAEVPDGFGVGWIDQLVPFQASARVVLPAPLFCIPTASQAVRELHDTATSEALVDPEGLTVDIRDQAVPFHRSARVAPLPAWSKWVPTAIQAEPEEHETPLRRPWGAV